MKIFKNLAKISFKFLIHSIIITLVLGFSGFKKKKFVSEKDKDPSNSKIEDHDILIPDSNASYPSLFFYDLETGNIKFIISGDTADIYELNHEILIQNLKMLHVFKDKKGQIKYIEIRSDTGKFNYKNFNFEAMKNVKIILLYEYKIETDYIYWDYSKQNLKSKMEDSVLIHKMIKPEEEVLKKDPKKKSTEIQWIRISGKNFVFDFETGNIEIEDAISITKKDWVNKKIEK